MSEPTRTTTTSSRRSHGCSTRRSRRCTACPTSRPGSAEQASCSASLEVLAAPLAVLRQSIEELHADLFIDTADDRIVPYLAEMVGTELVFPDAESNRRDVRGTVGWRRRKGTPAALEEMGGELTGAAGRAPGGLEAHPARAGPRPRARRARGRRPAPGGGRRAGDRARSTRSPTPSTCAGSRRRPGAATRATSRTGCSPDDHVPAARGDRRRRERSADSDVRYAMDPLGVRQPLRARRIAGDTRAVRRPHPRAALRRRRRSAGSAGPAGSRCASAGSPAGIGGTAGGRAGRERPRRQRRSSGAATRR